MNRRKKFGNDRNSRSKMTGILATIRLALAFPISFLFVIPIGSIDANVFLTNAKRTVVLKVVVLSHRVPYPPIKGEKIRTYHQLEALRAAGAEIVLFCPICAGDDEKNAVEYTAETGIEVITAQAGSGRLRMLKNLLTGRSLSVARFHTDKLQKKLNRYLASEPVDIVYCTSSAMYRYAENGAPDDNTNHNDRHGIATGYRVIVDFMDLDSDKWQRFSEVTKFPMSHIYRYESRVLGMYEKLVQRSVDYCLFVSQEESDLFCKANQIDNSNIRVIGNGVDFSDFYPPAHIGCNAPPTLLFTGVMDYLPNEDAICWFTDNVWGLVTAKYPDAKLVIAGMNPGKRVRDLQGDTNITVTGFVDDILPYYHQADLFIAPFQIARGVQNKVLQAFACGLPVVTTAIGAEGIKGLDENHCLIARSPQQFATQVETLIEDAHRYQQQSTAARRLIRNEYKWSAKNQPLVELVFG